MALYAVYDDAFKGHDGFKIQLISLCFFDNMLEVNEMLSKKKQQKKEGLYELMRGRTQEKIAFYDGRPGASGVTREMLTPEALGARCDFKYSESVFCDQKDRHFFSTGGVVGPARLCTSIAESFEHVALADLGEPFGICTVADRDILKGTTLGIYGGFYLKL